MISIEMITKDDAKINKTIEEMLSMGFSDIEIIIVDSSIKNCYKDYEHLSSIKYIHEINLNFLSARLKANDVASGDYVLLLDSTRIINKNILEECINLSKNNDMIIIPEINKSNSKILNEKSNLKCDTNHILSNCNPINGIFLPRFYKKKLIDEAFEIIQKNINKSDINKICSLEDRMLYLEASKICNKIGVCKNYLIHRESDSLTNYAKKYYRYGKCNYYVSTRILYYSYLGKPSVKKGNKESILHSNSIKERLLFFIRSTSFFFGFFISKFKN